MDNFICLRFNRYIVCYYHILKVYVDEMEKVGGCVGMFFVLCFLFLV